MLVNYIMNSCGHIPDNKGVATQLASRYGLAGADSMFIDQFNQAIVS